MFDKVEIVDRLLVLAEELVGVGAIPEDLVSMFSNMGIEINTNASDMIELTDDKIVITLANTELRQEDEDKIMDHDKFIRMSKNNGDVIVTFKK